MGNIKDQVEYFKCCLAHRTDDRFRKMVMTIGDDPELVSLKSYGSRDMGVIYHIAPGPTGSGFFADFNRTLAYLYYADTYGLRPVIEWPAGFMYAEDHPVHGTTNPWEYYFAQPSDITVSDVRDARCVIACRKENAALAGRLNSTGRGYDYSDEYLSEMGRIVRGYVRFNGVIDEQLTGDTAAILPDDGALLIGVHVRGTDFKRNYVNHPTAVTADEYIARVRELTEKYAASGRACRIFLATDDSTAVGKFSDTFGDTCVLYTDVKRSDGDETVMKSSDTRADHHYRLGYEVLRDMYTLSRCDVLVAGLSQVSTAARIWKCSRSEDYEDLILIDKGINRSGDVCR